MKITQGADDTSVPQSGLAAISNTSNVTDRYNEDQHKAASEESLECQKFIESIREEEFGMGVDLGASGAELRQKMNDRLGRALHRLSQDLYSKDMHFVLELVQNADDNAYEADVWPAVEFILQDTGITIVNNEVCIINSTSPVFYSINLYQKHSRIFFGKGRITYNSWKMKGYFPYFASRFPCT